MMEQKTNQKQRNGLRETIKLLREQKHAEYHAEFFKDASFRNTWLDVLSDFVDDASTLADANKRLVYLEASLKNLISVNAARKEAVRKAELGEKNARYKVEYLKDQMRQTEKKEDSGD